MSDPILTSLNKAEKTASESSAKIESAWDLLPYVSVLDPDGVDLQQMEPWPLAKELLSDFWPNNKRTAIIKPRQMGVSWDFALYCLYHCGWKKYRTLGSANTTKDMAAELIQRMKVLWSTLPAHLRPAIKGNWGTYHVTFMNGSRVVCLATTDVAGAGFSFSLLGIDEAGLIQNLGANWAALLPAVEKGELHLFSTPRGDSNKYAQIIKAARAGSETFKLKEIHWSERPDRDQDTKEGRAWLASRKEELSKNEFDREYGCKFQRAGNCYFGEDSLAALKLTIKKPKEEIWQGKLKIFSKPVPGEKYVIGGDVAEGIEDGDYSDACVLNKLTGEEVARLHGHIGMTPYAEDLVRLAKLYNKAWLAIEANNHGHAVCMWIYRHLKYRRLFRESKEAEGNLSPQSRYRLGITTSRSSKPAMLGELDHAIGKGAIVIRDAAAVEEIKVFIGFPDGSYGAMAGYNDDRVISTLLAQHARGRRVPKSR